MIKAYTKVQQCRCITFEDMNIFLSAIFIFCGLMQNVEKSTNQTNIMLTNVSMDYSSVKSKSELHIIRFHLEKTRTQGFP